jgi:hypothetical protein
MIRWTQISNNLHRKTGGACESNVAVHAASQEMRKKHLYYTPDRAYNELLLLQLQPTKPDSALVET